MANVEKLPAMLMPERKLHELRRLWDEGIAIGPSMDGEKAFARIKKKLEAKKRTAS